MRAHACEGPFRARIIKAPTKTSAVHLWPNNFSRPTPASQGPRRSPTGREGPAASVRDAKVRCPAVVPFHETTSDLTSNDTRLRFGSPVRLVLWGQNSNASSFLPAKITRGFEFLFCSIVRVPSHLPRPLTFKTTELDSLI